MRWQNTRPRVRRSYAPTAFINPCLPTKVDKPPAGDDWAHEIKHDGFRLQIHTGPAGVKLYTMTGADWTKRYPLIVEAAINLKAPAIIDAEACVAGDGGVTDFKAMESRRSDGACFAYAFDLMMLDGEDLRKLPWIERRALLAKLCVKRIAFGIRLNEHHVGDGPEVYAAACRMGLEGIVSKRIDAPYRSGRSRSWLKVKNPEAPGTLRFKS